VHSGLSVTIRNRYPQWANRVGLKPARYFWSNPGNGHPPDPVACLNLPIAEMAGHFAAHLTFDKRAPKPDGCTKPACKLGAGMIKLGRLGTATFETPDLDKAVTHYTHVNGLVLNIREKKPRLSGKQDGASSHRARAKRPAEAETSIV
jgi:hypothetical protein